MTEFVRRERKRDPHLVRLYDPPNGGRFRFRSTPGVWIRHPQTGTIMRLATYNRMRS